MPIPKDAQDNAWTERIPPIESQGLGSAALVSSIEHTVAGKNEREFPGDSGLLSITQENQGLECLPARADSAANSELQGVGGDITQVLF